MPEDENEAEADAAAPQEEAVGRSFMVFEEKIDDSKDMSTMHSALYHHEEMQSLPGYSLQELLLLARSSVT